MDGVHSKSCTWGANPCTLQMKPSLQKGLVVLKSFSLSDMCATEIYFYPRFTTTKYEFHWIFRIPDAWSCPRSAQRYTSTLTNSSHTDFSTSPNDQSWHDNNAKQSRSSYLSISNCSTCNEFIRTYAANGRCK